MSDGDGFVLFDKLKGVIAPGEFKGSIISKCKDEFNSIIFADNFEISEENGIKITEGLQVGFQDEETNKVAFSRKLNFNWETPDDSSIEYTVRIPDDIMDQYDEGQFGEEMEVTSVNYGPVTFVYRT